MDVHHALPITQTSHSQPSQPPPPKRGPGRPISTTTDHELELKREKARERQRRKRARDKLSSIQRSSEVVLMDEDGGNALAFTGDGQADTRQGVARQQRQPVAEEELENAAMALIRSGEIANLNSPEQHQYDMDLDRDQSLAPPPPIYHQQQHQHQIAPPPPPPPQTQLQLTHRSSALPSTPAAKRPRLVHSMSNSSASTPTGGAGGSSSLLVTVPEPPGPLAEEDVKRQRVRLAARDRQRKHRALVKSKRMSMAEGTPGASMPPNGPQGFAMFPQMHHPQQMIPGGAQGSAEEQMLFQEHVAAAVQAQAQMNAALVLAAAASGNQASSSGDRGDESMDQQAMVISSSSGPPQSSASMPNHSRGTSFASTLILALQCAPLLKQHLMKTLHMEETDLPAVEQVVASAWEHWDNIVRDRLLLLSSHLAVLTRAAYPIRGGSQRSFLFKFHHLRSRVHRPRNNHHSSRNSNSWCTTLHLDQTQTLLRFRRLHLYPLLRIPFRRMVLGRPQPQLRRLSTSANAFSEHYPNHLHIKGTFHRPTSRLPIISHSPQLQRHLVSLYHLSSIIPPVLLHNRDGRRRGGRHLRRERNRNRNGRRRR